MTNLQLPAQSWRMPPLGVTLLPRGWGADGAGGATRNGEPNYNSSVPILWRFVNRYILYYVHVCDYICCKKMWKRKRWGQYKIKKSIIQVTSNSIYGLFYSKSGLNNVFHEKCLYRAITFYHTSKEVNYIIKYIL